MYNDLSWSPLINCIPVASLDVRWKIGACSFKVQTNGGSQTLFMVDNPVQVLHISIK